VLAQKKSDTGKIYSLHEPHTQCISKGKKHKKYEFGSKMSLTTTKKSGVIIGALNLKKKYTRQQNITACLGATAKTNWHHPQK
jgi:IS5 family transposase